MRPKHNNRQHPIYPVFESLDYQPAVDDADDNPINALFKVGSPSRYNSDGWSTLVFVGAFFQFTATDRYAWNQMVLEGILPDSAELLGATWCRLTEHLPEEAYEDHMPKATKYAKGQCSPQFTDCLPPARHNEGNGGPDVA